MSNTDKQINAVRFGNGLFTHLPPVTDAAAAAEVQYETGCTCTK